MGPSLVAALLLIPLIFLLVEVSKRKSISMKTPLPSPPKIPFIELSKKHLQVGSIPTLVVSSPSSAQQITRTHDLVFASRPSLKASKILLYNNDMTFAPNGECWRQIRKICVTNLLSLKMVQSFSLVRMEEVSLVIERIARVASTNNGVVCLSDILNSLTCDVLCKSVLGSSISEEKNKHLCELIRKNVAFFSDFFFEDYFHWLRWLDVVFGLEGKLRRHSLKWDAHSGELIEDHIFRLKEEEIKSGTNFIDVILRLQACRLASQMNRQRQFCCLFCNRFENNFIIYMVRRKWTSLQVHKWRYTNDVMIKT